MKRKINKINVSSESNYRLIKIKNVLQVKWKTNWEACFKWTFRSLSGSVLLQIYFHCKGESLQYFFHFWGGDGCSRFSGTEMRWFPTPTTILVRTQRNMLLNGAISRFNILGSVLTETVLKRHSKPHWRVNFTSENFKKSKFLFLFELSILYFLRDFEF